MSFLGTLNPLQLASGAGRTVRAVRERMRADHSTLARRQVRFVPQAMVRYYLYVAVAPSRCSIRPWDDQQVARAQRFASLFAAEPWTAQPLMADGDVTTFGVEGADGMFDRVLYAYRNGLVEMEWALRCEETAGRHELEAAEVARVAAVFALAVASPEYEALSRAGTLRRRVRRTDWLLCLSTAVPTTKGQQQWDALRFPSEAPQRADNARAHMPVAGYGQEALRSLRRRRAPRQVPVVLLRELFAANGYYAIGTLHEELTAEGLRHALSSHG